MDRLDVATAGSLVIVPAHVQRLIETRMKVNVSGNKQEFLRTQNTSLNWSQPGAKDGLREKCRSFRKPFHQNPKNQLQSLMMTVPSSVLKQSDRLAGHLQIHRPAR
jgi:hypothetical protein